MLRRSHRFSFQRGLPRHIFNTLEFVLRYEQNSGSLKCAVVVGKKVDKRAVMRNNIKRKLVAIVQEVLPVETSYNIVIYAKRPILENQDSLSLKLTEALKATKII